MLNEWTSYRSDLAWKELFKRAGLKLIREKVQEGLPVELFVVKMYAGSLIFAYPLSNQMHFTGRYALR